LIALVPSVVVAKLNKEIFGLGVPTRTEGIFQTDARLHTVKNAGSGPRIFLKNNPMHSRRFSELSGAVDLPE